jgi:serpin B
VSLLGCSTVSESSDAGDASVPTNQAGKVNRAQNVPMDDNTRRLVSGFNKFGFKLYSQILDREGGNNLFVSAPSVAQALSMAYNGAVGETKEAMSRALEIQGLNHEALNQANLQLKTILASSDPKVTLQVANSLWARKGLTFNPEFVRRNTEFYGAQVAVLDFEDPNAPATMNSWVKNNTGGKIEKIIDQIESNSILFLINAIYFKGLWSDPFEKDLTKEVDFTTGAGAQKRHPLMHQQGSYQYFEDQIFQAVSIPYGSRRMSMYLFLPASGRSLNEFHKALSAENWDAWMSKFQKTPGEIAVPRFKLEFETKLNEALKTLGMESAFNPNKADFSGIIETSDRVYISNVKHKTFVDVNEEGTEAGAATSVEIGVTSMRAEPKPFKMIINRPFFCAIRDNSTGLVVFMGSIIDPK